MKKKENSKEERGKAVRETEEERKGSYCTSSPCADSDDLGWRGRDSEIELLSGDRERLVGPRKLIPERNVTASGSVRMDLDQALAEFQNCLAIES